MPSDIPTLLFVGGHDPSGGAGLQADIETALAHGCRALSVVSCLTTQDSRDVRALHPQPAADFAAQLDCLLADIRPDWVKIGLLGDAALARALGERLAAHRLPAVLDPVLAAGGGTPLADEALVTALREALLPHCRLITPNRAEARRLAGLEDAEAAARRLRELGPAVLLTGADEAETTVRNRLIDAQGAHDFEWPLLPHRYHGSGCTLAAACACRLAAGEPLAMAVQQAQEWTWRTLQRAGAPGHGQWLPDRRERAV